ncbi:hypothetical protein K1719_031549 [Acacia pycnantha]|nr:hypothetical protein K1719_031549 [Acacia pycnantha]
MMLTHTLGTTTLGVVVPNGIIITVDSRASLRYSKLHDEAWKLWSLEAYFNATLVGDVHHLMSKIGHFENTIILNVTGRSSTRERR